MKEIEIRPGERMDDLQRNGLRILQNPQDFCFGMDAVLLADFAVLRRRERVADMGTGTGILPLLLSQNESTAHFDAFEWQPEMADMAARSVAMNGLEERIVIHATDFRSAWQVVGRESMDAVVCNPPYGKQGGTLLNDSSAVALARHETQATISDVAAACAALLRTHGRLYMVFPAPRMLELCDALRQHSLEPKRIRMVCSKLKKPPYLVLMEAMKNARPSLLWMPPLVVYHSDGRETAEMERIYHRGPFAETTETE